MANIHRTPEQWQQILNQQASSGLQIATFCKQQKLNTSSFYAWRKRLANNTQHATMTETLTGAINTQDDWLNVIPEQTIPSQHWDIELALPQGVVLRMMKS